MDNCSGKFLMKKLGLDMGDVWVGMAISDGAGITCRPYETVKLDQLEEFLKKVFDQELIDTVVVGHPVTVGGGRVSEQTKSVEKIFEILRSKFSSANHGEIKWVLWDERFSSKRAASMMKGQEKKKEHSIAAAFILQNYLDGQALLTE